MTTVTVLPAVAAAHAMLAAERDQGLDLGSVLGGVAWFVLPILAFMAVVWLGIRALRARGDMTETDSY